MTNANVVTIPKNQAPSTEIIENVVIKGDLSGLAPAQRAHYYGQLCNSLGLNPLTKPFAYITLNGKLTLYAKRDATDQLRARDGVSISRIEREMMGDVAVVTAHAALPNGRTDSSIGAVSLKGLSGEALANAIMKAETKAKRRVTLSICGLGFLDETEIGSIPSAEVVHDSTPKIAEPQRKSSKVSAPPIEAEPEPEDETRLFVVKAEWVKDSKDPKKPWSLYKVSLSDGHDYSTFSESIYKNALHASQAGLEIEITWEPGKNEGQRTMTSLTLIEGPAGA